MPRLLSSAWKSCGWLGLCLIISGCGDAKRPPLGYVSGKVTINGEPLAGAIVAFTPDQGRMATSITDKAGRYDIEYVQGVHGCKVGPNKVTFFAPTDGKTSHPIPPNYSTGSEFKVDVKPGRNTQDFALKSTTDTKATPTSGTPGRTTVD